MGSWKEEVAPFFHAAKIKILVEAEAQKIKGHWGAVGDGREDILKRFLTPFLPPTHRLSKSVVYDSKGNERSPEFDLVLSNLSWSESVFAEEKKPVFVENVVAVFEVKTKVDKADIEKFDSDLTKLSKLVRVFHPTTMLQLLDANHALTCRLAEGVAKQFMGKDVELGYVRQHQQKEPIVVGALDFGPKQRLVSKVRAALFGYAGVGEKMLLQHLNRMNHKLDLVVVLNVGAYCYDYEECKFIKMTHDPCLHRNLELVGLVLMVSDWINRSTDDRTLLRGHLEDYL